jgi:hypothetical protein
MEVSSSVKRRRGYRRSRSIRRHGRGVVSVVGTLLALLVFFALFGIFVTQYVPIWMTDNEAAFTAGIQASFANLKSNIGTQIESGLEVPNGAPLALSTPFTLTSAGIPLLAQGTAATLNYIPRTQGVYVNVSMQYGPGGQPHFYQNLSLGTITAYLPNRYYSSQVLEYEDDGVIQSQGDTNQVMLYPPSFVLNGSGNYRQGSLTLVDLYGNATQVVSQGTVEAFSNYDNVEQFPSNGSTTAPGTPFTVSVTFGTLYPCAWAVYLNNTLTSAHLGSGAYTLTPSTCVASHNHSTPVKLVLNGFTSFDLILGSFTVVIGVGAS